MPSITINGNTLQLTADGPRLTTQPAAIRTQLGPSAEVHTQAPDASKSDYVLVKTKGPLTTHQKVELANLGLSLTNTSQRIPISMATRIQT
jgi:hypothetical protein